MLANHLFLNVVMLQIKFRGKSREHNASNYSVLLDTREPQKRSKYILKVMLHIKLKDKKCRKLCKFDLMQTPDLLGWVKKSDIEIVQISI